MSEITTIRPYLNAHTQNLTLTFYINAWQIWMLWELPGLNTTLFVATSRGRKMLQLVFCHWRLSLRGYSTLPLHLKPGDTAQRKPQVTLPGGSRWHHHASCTTARNNSPQLQKKMFVFTRKTPVIYTSLEHSSLIYYDQNITLQSSPILLITHK